MTEKHHQSLWLQYVFIKCSLVEAENLYLRYESGDCNKANPNLPEHLVLRRIQLILSGFIYLFVYFC